jgi:hypothetical protein
MEAQKEQKRKVQSAEMPAFDVGGDTMRKEVRIRRKVRDFVGRGGNQTGVKDLDSRQCMIAFNRLAQKEIRLRLAAFNWMKTIV